MTEKSQEIEEIQEDQDVKETEEMQEVQDVMETEEPQEAQEEQDILEAEEVQEAQEVRDDEPQIPDEEQPDISQPDQEITTTVESVVEAVLFASDESLTEARLANIVDRLRWIPAAIRVAVARYRSRRRPE